MEPIDSGIRGRLHAPRRYFGVTVSSTFADLNQHREAVIAAIDGLGMHAVCMERDGAKPGEDLVDSSLQMVRDGAGYVGIITRKYGQIPASPDRNPHGLSITELEFNEALRLGRPILLFVMDRSHAVTEDDVELDPEKRRKLEAFRERAKQIGDDNPVHRIYDSFKSLQEFIAKANRAVSRLRESITPVLPRPEPSHRAVPPAPVADDSIPLPPELYAEPRYTGSHKFLGRRAQLASLDDWAAPSDPNPVLLFDAIGGTGKSILTWTWINDHAVSVRPDFVGRFWYSFYERGADMGDFCRRATAYMTGKPLKTFRGKKTAELRSQLCHLLQAKPWFLVMDGLERILVAYNRLDAAEVRDEDVNAPTDQIAERDPRSTIRAEDGDLLRDLASAAHSKILVTSRLVPTALLAQSGQTIPGVRREPLPGLLAGDAEDLFRSCGVVGDSHAIRDYLKRNCDCHPLVIGVLAGLVNSYHPAPGNFDRWVEDSRYGAALDLGALDLIQRRNHILRAAIDALPAESRRLLSMFAVLSDAVDYPTLCALNPFLPPEPEEVRAPIDPRDWPWWSSTPGNEKTTQLREYEEALERHQINAAQREAWLRHSQSITAVKPMARAIEDLKSRGLLQFDRRTNHYDLHPVVRSVAALGLKAEEKEGLGQRVVDHFTARAHNPWEQASSLDDLRDGLQVVRTSLKIGRLWDAVNVGRADLIRAMLFNLEANAEVLALIRPFFPDGWSTPPPGLQPIDASYLLNEAHIALRQMGQNQAAMEVLISAIKIDISNQSNFPTNLFNLSISLKIFGRLAQSGRCRRASLAYSELAGIQEDIFRARLDLFEHALLIGSWAAAQEYWNLLDAMGRAWSRAIYRPGDAEYWFAEFQFRQGFLTESEIHRVDGICKEGKNRIARRNLYRLSGRWRQDRREWTQAADSFTEAVRMAREIGQEDREAGAGLALARYHLGDIELARREAHAISSEGTSLTTAELWAALGEPDRAVEHALAAYRQASADGEPYVFRFELERAKALLQTLGVEPPVLPRYDPAKDGQFPLEDEIKAVIDRLSTEKAAGNDAGQDLLWNANEP